MQNMEELHQADLDTAEAVLRLLYGSYRHHSLLMKRVQRAWWLCALLKQRPHVLAKEMLSTLHDLT